MVTGDLKRKIDSLFDIFWRGGITNPLTATEQLTVLVFLKLLDIKYSDDSSVFPEKYNCCKWRVFTEYDDDKMFENMTAVVYPFLKGHLLNNNKSYFPILNNAVFVIPNKRMLRSLVLLLDGLNFYDKDILGDIYEYFLSKLSSSGINGQFRTPRSIISMITELLTPTCDDVICDIAMGSGGFLCSANSYAISRNQSDKEKKPIVYGFDTDSTMVRLSAMNMLLHGMDYSNIRQMDSLSVDNKIRDFFTLILANPPFTGTVDAETVSGDILAKYNTKKTELLFLRLILLSLKKGGRAGVIVPDGVLFGVSKAHRTLREELVENNSLLAVISLPAGIFRPYTNITTSVLIFKKGNEDKRNGVWFYKLTGDGFSLDDKRKPTDNNDIPDVITRFSDFDSELLRDRTEQSFVIPVCEIKRNDYDLSFDRYAMQNTAESEYKSTESILDELVSINKRMNENMDKLIELIRTNK